MPALLMGNGHNPACPKFVSAVGGIDVIKRLVEGIRWWASQEDGVPEELWDAFKQAVFIVEGKIISDKQG